ncbi:MAG TPA: hypothetical protein VFE57_12910, partial [Cyclobacteriaceae bacterium]|nr:hypothetical protein [Cyclobacteriaceae bacterium]
MAASKGKIVSSVIGYGALSWGLIQVLSTIIPAFSLPQFYLTWTIIFVAVAFPFYLILIWRQPGFLGFLSLPGDKAVIVPVPADGINRILISKFKVLRDGTATDFLSVSLPEAIANALIGIKKLSVQLDTTGIAHYNPEQLAEFASTRKLNAILTGSILTVENQVRITASLIEQPTNAVIWTESTQSLIGDLFELQDLISQKIIKALRLKLTDEERLGIEKKNTKSAEAYELFLKANELSIHVDQWEAAKDMYIQCLEKDPTFSSAMARLARCYRVLGKYTLSDTESVRNLAYSEAYISQAMRLDPQSDMAIGLYAQLLVDEGKPIEALKLLLRRIKDSNSNANLYASLVHVLRFCGLLNESLEADKIA